MANPHQIEKVQMDVPQITYNLHQGQEIQFLFYNQADKKFQLNQEVIDLLLQHGTNISFIFNIGEQNIGKTFLFNHALDLDSRYNSFKPQIPGARMWTEPFYKKEDNLIVFFVDVEGFGQDENFTNFIWILAFMLSSCIIYSTQGKISENKMVNMNFLNYLADNLQFAQGRMENEYSMAYYSPKFIWLMKDYQIDEYDDNNYQLEPDKFLEQKLCEEYSNQEALILRDLFINIFKNRSALDFDQPPYQQFNFDQLSLNLSPYYKDQIDFLKEKIYSNSQIKLYDGISFSQKMLVNFISCMIELYNENEIINYQEILGAVLERECEQQLESASQMYTSTLAQNFGNRTDPISDEEMFVFFQQARQAAIESFAIREEIREKFSEYDEYLDKLQNYMNEQEDKLTQINEGLAQNKNQEIAQQLLEKYQRELLSVEHSGLFSQKYGNVIKQCCQEYQNLAKGNQSEKVLIILLKELFKISFERLEQDQNDLNEDDNNDLNEMKNQIEQKRSEINEQFRQITIQKQQAQEEYDELVEDNEEKSKRIQNLLEQNSELQKEVRDKEEHVKNQSQLIKDQQEELKKSRKKRGFLCFKKQLNFINKFCNSFIQ